MTGQPFDLGPDLRDEEAGGDLAVLRRSLERIGQFSDWALEFGVGNGTSLRFIAGSGVPVIGFDSFKGLPEDWRPEYRTGHFSEIESPRGIPGATIVVGWFDEVLPTYEFPERVSLIHFDADLYASTRSALMAVRHLLQPGVILVFDEFFGYTDDLTSPDHPTEGRMPGEQRAFREFTEDEPSLTWDVIGHGREQWAIQIKTGVQ